MTKLQKASATRLDIVGTKSSQAEWVHVHVYVRGQSLSFPYPANLKEATYLPTVESSAVTTSNETLYTYSPPCPVPKNPGPAALGMTGHDGLILATGGHIVADSLPGTWTLETVWAKPVLDRISFPACQRLRNVQAVLLQT